MKLLYLFVLINVINGQEQESELTNPKVKLSKSLLTQQGLQFMNLDQFENNVQEIKIPQVKQARSLNEN